MMDWKCVKTVQPAGGSWYAIMFDHTQKPIPEELWPLMNAAYNAGHQSLADNMRMMIGAAREGR